MSIEDDVDRLVGVVSPVDGESRPRRRVKKTTTAVVAAPARALPADVEDHDVDEDARDESDDEGHEKDDGADDDDLLPRDLPRPRENSKTLSSLMSHYKVGVEPDFSVQVHRLLPKYYNGVQMHGYLEDYQQPITEEFIANEFGGGTYQVRFIGPDPKRPPSGTRPYENIKVDIAGQPNVNRLTRREQARTDAQAPAAPSLQSMAMQMPMREPESVVNQAMKMANEASIRDRDDRIAAEKRADTLAKAASSMIDPVVEAERRRSDDLIAAERERSKTEREMLQQQLKDRDKSIDEIREKLDDMQNQSRPSVSEEIKMLMPIIGRQDDGASAKLTESITRSLLDRHSVEIEAMNKQHQHVLESMRNAHQQEITSMREAHTREMASEREQQRLREQRLDERLAHVNEERERDRVNFQKQEDQRDRQWKDRLEDQSQNLKSMYESRIENQKTNLESRLDWQKSENEQLLARIRILEAQVADRGDITKQLGQLRDLKEVAKGALGLEEASTASSGGAIGLSGDDSSSGTKWAEVLPGLIQNLPDILDSMRGLGGGGAQQPQQVQQQVQQQQTPPQPGQVVQTPQGPMVVVQGPDGQLALAPKDQFDAYQQRRAMPAGVRQRGILAPPRRSKPSEGLPVPNMAIGLPKRPVGPGQHVEPPPPEDADRRQTAAAPAQAAPKTRTSKPQQTQEPMDKTQIMIAKQVAKLVHESVTTGQEPEEFVDALLKANYPDALVRGIAEMSDGAILTAISTVEPNSAGCTPAGQRFVREAMKALRAAI